MRIIYFVIIFSLACITACVNPLDITIDKEVNILIVEGAITTLPGTNWVKLTRSAKYGSIFEGYVRPALKANVVIRDSDGSVFNLEESSGRPGVYYTRSDFLPEVGQNYTLLITLANGVQYTSLPEKINKAAELIDLKAQFTSRQISADKIKSGFDVYATFKDSPEEKNFYMWKNYGELQPVSLPPYLAIELDCSDGKCWVRKSSDRTIRLLQDRLVNGNMITDKAAFIKDDCVRVNKKFLVRIEQHTLTKDAFQFFKLLKAQTSIDGDLFDPPPATLRGNMINLSDPNENVIGYFRASDVSVDSLVLEF